MGYDEDQQLKVGQIWWARRHVGLNLFKAKITDITARTIEVEDLYSPLLSGMFACRIVFPTERKVKGEFDFVELIEDDFAQPLPTAQENPTKST